jgi:hypothetical protein
MTDEKELIDLLWQHLKNVCAYNPTGTGKEEAVRLVLVTKVSVTTAVKNLLLDKSLVFSKIHPEVIDDHQ